MLFLAVKFLVTCYNSPGKLNRNWGQGAPRLHSPPSFGADFPRQEYGSRSPWPLELNGLGEPGIDQVESIASLRILLDPAICEGCPEGRGAVQPFPNRVGGRCIGVTLFSSRGGNGPNTELARSLPASRLRELGFHSVPVSE